MRVPSLLVAVSCCLGLALVGCEGLLGLTTERSLDAEPYPQDGYEGCADERCDRCTSELHRCQCEGGTEGSCQALVGPKSGEPDDGSSSANGTDSGDDADSGIDTAMDDDTGAGEGGSSGLPEPDGSAGGGDGGSDTAEPDVTTVAEPDAPSTGVAPEPDAMGTTTDPLEPKDFMGCDTATSDVCANCVCDNCEAAFNACDGDEDCSVILDCTSGSECDPSLSNTPGSCYRAEFCKDEIDGHGGLLGTGVELLRDFTDCMDGSCSSVCGPGGDPNANMGCAPADDCKGCSTCHDECACAGGSPASCDIECGGPPGEQTWCSEFDECGACTTCLSDCVCAGKDLRQCEADCGFSYQCLNGNCGGCEDGSAARCECEGNSPNVCANNYLGTSCTQLAVNACETCECSECPSEYVECWSEWGCFDILNCMDTTRCVGVDCSQSWACGDLMNDFGGPGSRAASYAEALVSCRAQTDCSCNSPPPTTSGDAYFYCGSNQCYDGPTFDDGSRFWGCCADADVCGLDVQSLGALQQPGGGYCYATTQFGTDSTQCPPFYPDRSPYAAADQLQGCCRNDRTCGFWDNQLGLGCVPPEVFGTTATTSCVP